MKILNEAPVADAGEDLDIDLLYDCVEGGSTSVMLTSLLSTDECDLACEVE